MRPLLIACLPLVIACATPHPPVGDDPDARREVGRIVSKRPLGGDMGGATRRFVPVTVGNRVVMVDTAQSPALPGPPFNTYVVKLEDGTLVQVFGDYPGYRTGDCVKVLISSNPTYPRFDLGGQCSP
ncbi:MAG: hypothetical protein HZB71_14975 [Betaproteobacteria bacterium]|nr:hypothetical protein [Betaproteobacteria bacterium]